MSKQEDQKTYLRGAKPIDGDTKAWYNLVIEVPKIFLPGGTECECHKRDDITQKYMYDNLSMLRLKLDHVSKSGPRYPGGLNHEYCK